MSRSYRKNFVFGVCRYKSEKSWRQSYNRIFRRQTKQALRRAVLNEDKDSYCRMIGRGLMIMGLGALISSLLSACLNNENYLFILLASSAIGVTMCYYAVFKYNMYRKIQS